MNKLASGTVVLGLALGMVGCAATTDSVVSGGTTGASALPTPISFTPKSTASGTIAYHQTLPYRAPVAKYGDTLTLSSNNTELIASNFVAGAMLGRLLREKDPKLSLDKDYIYGALMAQLIQMDITLSDFDHTKNEINPKYASETGQFQPNGGGPYSLGTYAYRMPPADGGVGLVNFTALQKGIGYSVAAQDDGSQLRQPTPQTFGQKYFGPMAAAYNQFNAYNMMDISNKDGTGPQGGDYASCMNNLRKNQSSNAVNSIYDLLLDSDIDSGTWSPMVTGQFRICAGMYGGGVESKQVKALGDYSLSDDQFKAATGIQAASPFLEYPRTMRLYLDQMYNQETFKSPAITGTNSINLSADDVRSVFQNSMGTLAYVDSSGKYDYIANNDSAAAYDAALKSAGLTTDSFMDISTPAGKEAFFTLLDTAINNLATQLGTDFGAVTQTDIAK